MRKYKPLPRAFFDRDTAVVARDLLGQNLIRILDGKRLVGLITETEAYLPFDDPACHSYRGKTKRNASMFKEAGHAYVYSMHTHNLLNVVTEGRERPGAVLIRTIEPVEGAETMKMRRGKESLRALVDGPGKICKALNITLQHDGIDLTGARSEVFVAAANSHLRRDVLTSGRIGISKATDLELRFYLGS